MAALLPLRTKVAAGLWIWPLNAAAVYVPGFTAVPWPRQPDIEVLWSQVIRSVAGVPRLSVTTQMPLPRRQLEESHSGVPLEATTTEVNLEPRSRRHGRFFVETAPTTKVTCSPGPYRCRSERMVNNTDLLAQVCRPGWGGMAAPRGATVGRARGRELRSAVSRAGACPPPACRLGPASSPE